ncbi:pyruvate dehydrogenase X component [Phanerochaete sordida]|uniref:Pyruvate dehydrogenase X component n=1 Tax=Phanerochaete sordida TaxID=48140 RepID=A0A9P3LA87_9APHY|nr:pyruvate dehydrogenase X component [Phanerochaete sordida]
MYTAHRTATAALRSAGSRRCIQSSASRQAVSKFGMPAMSPTMTEGGIASWKKKEGEAFSAGDVLLEIETDKATIDVEAQEDGVVGKILVTDGTKNVPVGQAIALLAEEGDDISNLEIPKEDSQPSPPKAESSKPKPETSTPPPPQQNSGSYGSTHATPQASHDVPSSSRTLFPSVLRLLQENGISDADKIKGSGVRGMVTKGDVLAYLGKASGPLGTYKAALDKENAKLAEERQFGKSAAKKDAPAPPLDGPALKRLIVASMVEASQKAYKSAPAPVPTFDELIADYFPPAPKVSAAPAPAVPPKNETKKSANPFEGLF